MPTRNPRVNVTVTPERYDLISRLAKIQSCSRSAILIELLDMVAPVWERVVVVAEAAQRAQVQAKEVLQDSLDRAEAEILPHVMQAQGQVDLLLQGVTRGPGKGARNRAKRVSKGHGK